MAIKQKTYTHQNLLRDLSEIKAVLDVESELINELVKMAIAKETAQLQFLF